MRELACCEARGEEGRMLGAGRCEWYAGGAGGVEMQGDAERTVQDHPSELRVWTAQTTPFVRGAAIGWASDGKSANDLWRGCPRAWGRKQVAPHEFNVK